MIAICSLLIQYAATMYFLTMAARIKVFTKEFMAHFAETHANAFPKRPVPPQWGYPDTGNGFYSKRLSYKDWYNMNNG